MRRNSNQGGITVFLSGVLLTLIIFACSIVDITRIHVAKLQAETALISAANSVLASYDTMIAKEYGIFSKDISNTYINNCLLDYANNILKPEDINFKSNILANLINPIDNNFFNLYDYEINITDININDTLACENGILYVKDQILEFMQYRAPFLLIEPFLEKLEVIQKTSKTSQLIKDKNNLVGQVKGIQDNFINLERLIDGIDIDEKKGKVKNELFPNYIKRLYTGANSSNIYSRDEIPNDTIRNKLNSNVDYMNNTINLYISNLEECEIVVNDIIKDYREYKNLQEEKELLVEELSELSSEEEDKKTYKRISKKIKSKKKDITKCLEHINTNIQKYNKDYEEILDCLSDIELLVKPYNRNVNMYGYKGINEAVLNNIQTIKNNSSKLHNKVNDFNNKLDDNKDDYIDSTYEGVKKEVSDIQSKIGCKENMKDSINNILAMEEHVKNNIKVLSNIEGNVNRLRPYTYDLIAYWFGSNIKNNEDRELIKDLLESIDDIKDMSLDINSNEVLNKINNSTYKNEFNTIKKSLDVIGKQLDKYNRNLKFNYNNMSANANIISEEHISDQLENRNDTLKLDSFKKYIKEEKEVSIGKEYLPSYILLKENKEENNIDITIKDETPTNNYLNMLETYSEKLKNGLSSLQNNIYINEYIIGIFKTATDKFDDGLTINNYKKDEHYLDYEVEYIIGGNLNQNANLQKVLSIIFGIRVACNIIHIVSNEGKRTLVTSTANAVAGWWTLGIGGVILTIIITLMWAIAESTVDISKLMEGEEIPFIKTTNTWYTLLDGNLDELIDENSKKTEITKKELEKIHIEDYKEASKRLANDNIDSSTTSKGSKLNSKAPLFNYKDYLRLILLTCNEDIKIYRILDLIQMNVRKKADDNNIILHNYITKYTVKANFSIKYMFFNLPFMPQKVKDINNNRYTFKVLVNAGY
jgi:hypothetical protein